MKQLAPAADMTFFQGMKWVNDDDFIVDSLSFHSSMRDYVTQTTAERIHILKNRAFLDYYDRLLAGRKVERMLEIGIWEGGSLLLFAHATDIPRISAIDIRNPSEAITRHLEAHNLQDRVHIHYGVSQGDKASVLQALGKDHGDQLLDLVIDDASHKYDLTKAAFETAFPRLRPGGVYVIEDWNWAHFGEEVFDTGEWGAAPALSNLILELCIAAGSPRGASLIDRIEVNTYFAAIIRGHAPLGNDFRLDDAIQLGPRQFKKL